MNKFVPSYKSNFQKVVTVISNAQARHWSKFGLLYETLQDFRSSNKDSLDFLQDGAVDSEPLHAKLYTIVVTCSNSIPARAS